MHLRASRLAQAALLALAVCLGLGDIAQVSPFTTLLLNGVHALLPLAIGLAALAILSERRWPFVPRTIALPLVTWLAVQAISALTSSSYRSDALATLGRPASGALLVCAVIGVGNTCRAWLRLNQALALGGLAIATIALAEASGFEPLNDWLASLQDGDIPIGDVPRASATLSHPNEAAMLLELTLQLLIAWAWTAGSRWRLPLTLSGMASMAAIVLTFSRAGIATAVLSLGLLALLAARRAQPRRALAIGLIGLAVPLTFGWAALSDPGLDRRLLANLDESSLTQPPRTQFWTVALQMSHDHPLLGVGPDNFRWLFASYSGTAADNLGIHAHNQYLEALADTGLLGFLTLAWLLSALVVQCVRGLRQAQTDWPWRAALLVSLSAWLLHALLDDFERFWPASVAFWLIVGLALSLATEGSVSLSKEKILAGPYSVTGSARALGRGN